MKSRESSDCTQKIIEKGLIAFCASLAIGANAMAIKGGLSEHTPKNAHTPAAHVEPMQQAITKHRDNGEVGVNIALGALLIVGTAGAAGYCIVEGSNDPLHGFVERYESRS